MRIKRDISPKPGIIGKIKIGEKRTNQNGKEYPVSLDYFIANSKIKSIEDSYNSYYQKQSTLPICFATNDDDFNTDNRFEIRNNQGKLYAYGDGHDFYISEPEGYGLRDNKTILEKNSSIENFMSKVATYLSTQKYTAEWKESLTLRFIVPKIPVLGVWELRTQASKTSIQQILSSYDMIKEINGGSIERIPFLLDIQKVKSSRVLQTARSYPVISLTPLLSNDNKQNLIESNEIKLLEK